MLVQFRASALVAHPVIRRKLIFYEGELRVLSKHSQSYSLTNRKAQLCREVLFQAESPDVEFIALNVDPFGSSELGILGLEMAEQE